MTEKTEEQMNDDAEAFIDMVGKGLPENMTNLQIVRVMGVILSSYSTGPMDTLTTLKALATAMRGFHMQAEAETCTCPSCVARRTKH